MCVVSVSIYSYIHKRHKRHIYPNRARARLRHEGPSDQSHSSREGNLQRYAHGAGVNWSRTLAGFYVSDCDQYVIRDSYTEAGKFAWRGSVRETDTLVCSSADREYVQLCCERHASSALLEST